MGLISGNRSGYTLITVLVALGLAAGVILFIVQGLNIGIRGQRHVELRGDLAMLRQTIFDGIDCRGTFDSAGIDPAAPGGSCGSTSAPTGQVGPFLRLRRRSQDGSVQFFTDPLGADGSAVFGGMSVRASCSQAEQTLIVRVARVAGAEIADPLTGQISSFESPNALFFGIGPRSLPLCFGNVRDPVEVRALRAAVNLATITVPGSFNVPLDPALPPLQLATAKRVGLMLTGNVNWDGAPPSGPCGDLVRHRPILRISRDGGGSWTEVGNFVGTSVHNAGTSVVASTAFDADPGERLSFGVRLDLNAPNGCRVETGYDGMLLVTLQDR